MRIPAAEAARASGLAIQRGRPLCAPMLPLTTRGQRSSCTHAATHRSRAALGRALACVGRVHAVPQGAGADCVAADNAVGSCVLVRESDGAAATTLHVWEAATEHGHEAWVSLANGAPPIPVRLERSSVDSDVALMAPIRRLALQLPAAVTL